MNQKEDMTMLVQLLVEHNPTALEYLYEYAPRLEYALQRRFGTVIDSEDVKDIVRDALIRAWQTGERFDPQTATLATWLNTIAHYEALSFMRTHTNLIQPTTRAELVEQCVAELEQRADDQGPSELMQQALQELPAQQAAMVHQYYYEGLTRSAIAELHHVREVTVKSQLSRARGTLRKRLASSVMTR